MIIDCKQHADACICGDRHRVTTRLAVIEAGCMQSFDSYMIEQGVTGLRAVLYDAGSYHAKGLVRPRADQEIVLPYGAKPDELTIRHVLSQITAEARVLVAVGSGAIDAIARSVAGRTGLQLVSCPTAASTDAFCMGGFGVAPEIVLADVSVLAAAPPRMTRAGMGLALSKCISLLDLETESKLSTSSICPVAISMVRQASIAAQGCCANIASADPAAIAQLMYSLLLFGIATQIMGLQRPLKDAAQHVDAILTQASAVQAQSILRGERVAKLLPSIVQMYHLLDHVQNVASFLPPQGQEGTWMIGLDGQRMPYSPGQIDKGWPDARRALADLPSMEGIASMLVSVGLLDTGDPLPDLAATLRVASYANDAPLLMQLAGRLPSLATDDRGKRQLRGRRVGEKSISRSAKGGNPMPLGNG